MKIKLRYIFVISFILCYNIFADMYVSPETLPQTALTFIKTYFPETEILYVEMDKREYEVKLSNGVEIEFMQNGEWTEIDGHYIALPTNIIPEIVLKTINHTHQNTSIIKIEKNWNVYEIKLNNMIKLYIDINGQLLGQKFDD